MSGEGGHESVFDSQCVELTGKTKPSLFLAWCIATGAGGFIVRGLGSLRSLVWSILPVARSKLDSL